MQSVTILGATGSIGESTLDVIGRNTDKYSVFAITANSRLERLIELATIHAPTYVVAAQSGDYQKLKGMVSDAGLNCGVLAGTEGLEQVASVPDTHIVMAAIVGAAGLLPTLAAAQAGKKVLLANKESLVMSGQLFMDAVGKSGAQLLPIDSEHNAIFQCLPANYEYANKDASGINKILLTGSGGPFLHTAIEELEHVTPQQACAHPNWDMGQKISVDSATMMNKGLEFVEACWLFGVKPEDIEVVIHPQSIIHSMVQYRDGSVLAQMGNPDMRTPIAHGLAYPKRIDAGVAPLNFGQMKDLNFVTPDWNRYPNLSLAIEAVKIGQAATTCLNAANEVAVDAFLKGKIKFTDIAQVNQQVTMNAENGELADIEQVIALDYEARLLAAQHIGKLS